VFLKEMRVRKGAEGRRRDGQGGPPHPAILMKQGTCVQQGREALLIRAWLGHGKEALLIRAWLGHEEEALLIRPEPAGSTHGHAAAAPSYSTSLRCYSACCRTSLQHLATAPARARPTAAAPGCCSTSLPAPRCCSTCAIPSLQHLVMLRQHLTAAPGHSICASTSLPARSPRQHLREVGQPGVDGVRAGPGPGPEAA
jgi:hypothetical protein